MKLQLVGHADDAKSRRVDAERGGKPFYPLLRSRRSRLDVARLVY